MNELLLVTCTTRGCGRQFEGPGLQCPDCRAAPRKQSPIEVIGNSSPITIKPPFPGRIEVTLPWSAFASDNIRTSVVGDVSRAKRARYDEALAHFRAKLREAYTGEPFPGPAYVIARFYVPDNLDRDHLNFSKILGDGLKGIVITKDNWQVMRDVRLRVEGIDRDRPRCDITVEAISG